MIDSPQFDVAVVGAGPAGCWAARHLARAGARVALVDGSHPREKPCGGGVTGRALALVGDAIDRAALPSCAIRTARFVDSSRPTSATVSLAPDALVVASRAEFDAALFAAALSAGACAIRERAVDVIRDGGAFVVRTATRSVRADRLIGADGANSLVRRRLARPFARADLSVAAGFFVHGASSDEILIELVADPPGYIWSFPRPTHLAVGICAQADAGVSSDALRETTRQWIRTQRLDTGRLESYAWPIPSLSVRSFQTLQTSSQGCVLIGDAAGLVDPITREGIYFALLSGVWAADALASAAARRERRYDERVRDEIVSELTCAAQYKAGFFRPRFTHLLVEALSESAGVRDVMAGLVAGAQPYRTLKRSLARTVEIGLAWRLLRSKWYN